MYKKILITLSCASILIITPLFSSKSNAQESISYIVNSKKIKDSLNEYGISAYMQMFKIFSQESKKNIYFAPDEDFNDLGKQFYIELNSRMSKKILSTIGIGENIDGEKYATYYLSADFDEYGEILIGNRPWSNSLIKAKVRKEFELPFTTWQYFGYKNHSMKNRIDNLRINNLTNTPINAKFKEKMESILEESFSDIPRITYVNKSFISGSTIVLSRSINNIFPYSQKATYIDHNASKEYQLDNTTSISFMYEKEINNNKFYYFATKELINKFYGFNKNGLMLEDKNIYTSTGLAAKFKNFFLSYEFAQWDPEDNRVENIKQSNKQSLDFQKELIASYKDKNFQITTSYYRNQITQNYISQKITDHLQATMIGESYSKTKLESASIDIELERHYLLKPFIQINMYKETETSLLSNNLTSHKEISCDIKNILFSIGLRFRTF